MDLRFYPEWVAYWEQSLPPLSSADRSPRSRNRPARPARLAAEEREAAALVVSRFRKALDASLSLPGWQSEIRRAMEASGFPGERQGVSFAQSVFALPLESKRELVASVFKTRPARLQRRAAQSLASAWGIAATPSGKSETALSQWPRLKRSLTIRLAARYRAYKSAQNTLYRNYEYISTQSAREICRDPSRLQDCEQEAALGLLQAIDRIEPGRPFASYAFQWTQRRIRNFLMRNSIPISAPINQISKASQFTPRNEKTLDAKSLALALNCLQQPYLEFTDELAERSRDLDEFTAPCPVAAAIKSDLADFLAAALSQLTAKQREVLALRFGLLDRDIVDTLQGIARATGISRQQVSRRESRALSKLESLFSPLLNELA